MSEWESAGAKAALSHDRPCAHCGHAMHFYLACSDTCQCTPALLQSTGEEALIGAR